MARSGMSAIAALRLNALRVAAGTLLAFCATAAQAHLVQSGLGPLYDGVVHLVLTPEDLIPAMALALLAGLRGKAYGRRVMFALPLAWLLGGVCGLWSHAAGGTDLAWLLFVLLGGLIASDLSVSLLAVTVLTALVGFYKGFESGVSLRDAGGGAAGLIGMTAALFVLASMVSALFVAWRWTYATIVGRAAGSWIAASGLLLLGWSLR